VRAARLIPLAVPLFADRAGLAAAIDMAAMVGLGFDPATEVFTPDPAHRLLGYEVCAVAGCGSEAWCKARLCGGCATRRAKDAERPLADFLSAGIPGRRPGERLCAVCRLPGTCRPAVANGLCLSCDRTRLARHQSVAAYVDGDGTFEPASPRPTLGTCAVVSCGRLVARKVHGLCEAHDQAGARRGARGSRRSFTTRCRVGAIARVASCSPGCPPRSSARCSSASRAPLRPAAESCPPTFAPRSTTSGASA